MHSLLRLYSIKIAFITATVLTLLALNSQKVEANTIFEGYYRVMLSGQHSGYSIWRYELDTSKKEFTARYYVHLRLSRDDEKKFINESLIAKAKDDFTPISYQYTALLEGKPVSVDAQFRDGQMAAKVIREGEESTVREDLPKGAFLSNFLIYLILQKGMTVDRKFSFQAVAEEDAKVERGNVHIVSEEKHRGHDAYKMEWTFKNMRTVSHISQNGQILSSEAPAQKILQELVKSRSEATSGFPFPENSIRRIFGNIPAGTQNLLHESTRPKTKVDDKDSDKKPDSQPPGVIVRPPPKERNE